MLTKSMDMFVTLKSLEDTVNAELHKLYVWLTSNN